MPSSTRVKVSGSICVQTDNRHEIILVCIHFNIWLFVLKLSLCSFSLWADRSLATDIVYQGRSGVFFFLRINFFVFFHQIVSIS